MLMDIFARTRDIIDTLLADGWLHTDLHAGNLGYIDDRLVLIDLGSLEEVKLVATRKDLATFKTTFLYSFAIGVIRQNLTNQLKRNAGRLSRAILKALYTRMTEEDEE
jgi:predicted unusual protein kinase regulating ubiquinone biosynthesis (AarF/ABC1/UbiB family)